MDNPGKDTLQSGSKSSLNPFSLWYSYPVTFSLFALGGLLTSVFSGSLSVLAVNAGFVQVLFVGMTVPSFTWLVQLAISRAWLDSDLRRLYWGDLARVCVAGSLALLPAAAVNLRMPNPPLWISAVNVLASVSLMATLLFRRSSRHSTPLIWPFSWCLTITLNMTLFVLASRSWW